MNTVCDFTHWKAAALIPYDTAIRFGPDAERAVLTHPSMCHYVDIVRKDL